MYSGHNLLYPAHISLDKLRGIGNGLRIGEKVVEICDSVCKNRLLKRAVSLHVADNFSNVSMRDCVVELERVVALIKDVVHNSILLCKIEFVFNVVAF